MTSQVDQRRRDILTVRFIANRAEAVLGSVVEEDASDRRIAEETRTLCHDIAQRFAINDEHHQQLARAAYRRIRTGSRSKVTVSVESLRPRT